NYNPKEKIYLFREDYDASWGKEIFLSLENKNRSKLFSFLRLRIPQQRHNQLTTVSELCPIFPVLKNAAIIREIQTFGAVVPIGGKKIALPAEARRAKAGAQHRGLGKKLLKQAEKITKKEFGLKKIAVISGVGARDYFRKLGYRLKDSYMFKLKSDY
ncbi:GNAT family N-acetyltransferase, partial [Patescibacteria group bacterium]|nr:GNAT family N-acetyltransferase [Patescibacteria group bacterium]